MSRVDTTGLHTFSTYSYTKFQMRTNKRNATLMLVPTMYAVAHGGGRKFMGESYNKVSLNRKGQYDVHRILNISTVPHRYNTMRAALLYLTPNLYDETLFQKNILSPFHRSNRRFYRFKVTPLTHGIAQIYAYPILKNTQVVRTKSIVDTKNGKIILADFEGEYDMTHFFISVNMRNGLGMESLLPKKCDLKANFSFMGNKISANYVTVYDLPEINPDSIHNHPDTTMMGIIRPFKLSEDEKNIYKIHYRQLSINDSIKQKQPKRPNFVKDFLWDVIGDNVLNQVKQGLGKQNQGYLRLSPILNPLYMGYSERKGFVYKFDMRGGYKFNENIELSVRFKAAYSFKQHLFYYRIPAIFKYNKKHNGYLQLEIGNGNRISSNLIARRIIDATDNKDSVHLDPQYRYTDFKDYYTRITNHWSISSKVGFEIGLVTHHRDAEYPEFYQKYGYPSSYRSVAPALALEWQPGGKYSPFFKLDYERSYQKLLGSNIDYERLEMDIQSIYFFNRRQSFSWRVGGGFYTQKGDHWYFVDYTNFRDNNLPNGWNDDWSGEFELLNSGWYNSSDYYFRTNCTYETPMLFAAWLPIVGRFIESERLYVNTLTVRHLHPYTEWGYGFSSRAISIGFFAAFKNNKFNGVGCKWSFELFRHW